MLLVLLKSLCNIYRYGVDIHLKSSLCSSSLFLSARGAACWFCRSDDDVRLTWFIYARLQPKIDDSSHHECNSTRSDDVANASCCFLAVKLLFFLVFSTDWTLVVGAAAAARVLMSFIYCDKKIFADAKASYVKRLFSLIKITL